MNITPVLASDYVEQNKIGQLTAKIIQTQDEPHVVENFNLGADQLQGILLTNRNTGDPIGHIYCFQEIDLLKDEITLKPIYLTVHPEYQRKGISKILRQLLFYDHLIATQEPDRYEKITVIPYYKAKNIVSPLFERLDPELVELNPSNPKSKFALKPKTVKTNLWKEFNNLNMKVKKPSSDNNSTENHQTPHSLLLPYQSTYQHPPQIRQGVR